MIWRERRKGQKLHPQDCHRIDIDIHFPRSAAVARQPRSTDWAVAGEDGVVILLIC